MSVFFPGLCSQEAGQGGVGALSPVAQDPPCIVRFDVCAACSLRRTSNMLLPHLISIVWKQSSGLTLGGLARPFCQYFCPLATPLTFAACRLPPHCQFSPQQPGPAPTISPIHPPSHVIFLSLSPFSHYKACTQMNLISFSFFGARR